jgi:hypothetical protein
MKIIPPNRIVASRPGGSEDYAGKENLPFYGYMHKKSRRNSAAF